MIGRGTSALISIVTPFILVRLLDQVDFGVYKQLFLIYATLYQILPLGMLASLYYFIPLNRDRRTAYILQAEVFLSVVWFLTTVLLYSFRDAVASILGTPILNEYLLEVALFTGFMMISAALEMLLVIDGKEGRAAAVTVVSELGKSIALLCPLLWWRDLHLMMWSMIGIAVLRVVALGGYLTTTWNRERIALNLAEVQRQYAYAIPFGMATLVTVFQGSVDKYVVSAWFGPAAFAIYSVGCFQLPILFVLTHSTAEVALVKMTELKHGNRIDELVDIWQQCTVNLAMIFIPLCALFFIIRQEFIEVVFTNLYLSSVPILAVTIFLIPLNALLPDTILRVFGDTRTMLYATLASVLMTIASLYFLMEWLGLLGAAISWVMAVALHTILLLWRSAGLVKRTISSLFPWREYGIILAISAFSAILAEIARNFSPISPSLRIVGAVGVFIPSYFLLVLKTNLIGQQYRQELSFRVRQVMRWVTPTV
jgi:O-antigen/teichoic acid export membrane protein